MIQFQLDNQYRTPLAVPFFLVSPFFNIFGHELNSIYGVLVLLLICLHLSRLSLGCKDCADAVQLKATCRLAINLVILIISISLTSLSLVYQLKGALDFMIW